MAEGQAAAELTLPTPKSRSDWRRALQARCREDLTFLAAEVDARKRDHAFNEAVEAMARFWRYSASNQWAIRWQYPKATRVAGRRTWEALGRKVQPETKPIYILAPARPNTGRFVAVEVFDIRQTRGRRLPELDLTLSGRTRHAGLLEKAATTLGIRVGVHLAADNAAAVSLGGMIRIRPGLSPRERVSAIAHELAHEILHQAAEEKRARAKRKLPPRTHAEEETEADATSYVVLRVLGLPSKAPNYIAWQGGDGATILRSTGRIQRAAKRILEAAGFGPPAVPRRTLRIQPASPRST